MEDLQKRLQFPSRDVQLAAANKLYAQITNSKELKTLSLPIDDKTKQILELNVLFEVIQGNNQEASYVCCQSVVALVKNGLLDFRFALNKLVSFIPTAKYGGGLVEGVADLLVLQASLVRQLPAADRGGAVFYSMRSPPHPFISMYVSKANLWPDIFQEVSRILSSAELKHWQPLWNMMRPFFMYILLDPQSAGQTGHTKSSLVSILISLCKDKTEMLETVMSFLLTECFPCLQVKTKMALHESFMLLDMTAAFLLTSQIGPNHHLLLETITNNIFSIAHQLSTSGEGILSVLTLISKLATHDITLLPDTALLDVSCLLLGRCNLREQSILLKLLDDMLSRQSGSTLVIVATVLPLLQTLSNQQSSVTMDTKLLVSNQRKASQMIYKISKLDIVADCKHESKDQERRESGCSCLPHHCTLHYLHRLLDSFKDPSKIDVWLSSTRDNLTLYPKNSLKIPAHLLLAAAAIFLQSTGSTELALQVLLDMVERDHAKATLVLSLFLYKFSQKHLTPALTKQLLFAMPELAHHKYALSPILKVVQSLASTPALSAVGMRLALKLWIKQERCFPQLQTLLSRSGKLVVGSSSVCDEYSISRVATVRDICITRPHQHGAELIPTLSKILNDCTKPSEATEAALAMDALKRLSEAEVVDIRTIWMVLAPKLSQDRRSKVQESICNLLSSVPELAVETDEFEEFRELAVTLLWQRTQHSNPGVVNAAYSALAEFEGEEFYLQDLPEQVISEVKGQEAEGDKSEEQETEEEEEAEDVPGYCFISLLKMLPEASRNGFQSLLSSLIQQELATIPRHLNFTITKKEAQSSSLLEKLVDIIPSIIYGKYETNKQPGLKPTLADSPLVFSGDPFCLLLLPCCWTSFMAKVFRATIDAMIAQAAPQGQNSNEDEVPEVEMIVWLKARDKLCDQLKNVARDNTSANPNCLLALAGLAVVSTQHYLSLGADAGKLATLAPESVSHQRWIAMVVESLLLVLDSSYKTNQRIFSWCQKGFRHESKSSKLVAALGLSQIAPMLIAVDADLIDKIITKICSFIGTESAPSDREAIDNCSMLPGVAMGLLLNKLSEEKYVEVIGDEALARIVTSLDQLEKLAFANDKHSSGAMLGLGMALSAMAADSSLHVGSQVTKVLDRLRAAIQGEDIAHLHCTVFSLTIAMLTASGFDSNIVTSTDAKSIVEELVKLSREHTGVRSSVGLLGHSLCVAAHPTADTIIMSSVREWKATLNSNFVFGDTSLTSSYELFKIPQPYTLATVDAIDGLVGFISGLGPLFSPSGTANFKTEAEQEMVQIIKLTEQLVIECQDLRLQAPLLVGLGTFSFVKSFSQRHKGAGPHMQYCLVELALSQCPSSHNASLFLSSWISTASLYNSLEFLLSISCKQVKSFLFSLVLPEVISGDSQVSVVTLRGLLGALRLTEPPQSVMQLLHEFTEKMFDSLMVESLVKPQSTFKLLAECLVYLPSEMIDVVSHPAQEGNLVKSTLLRSYLIGCGKQSMAWLNACIDVGMNMSSEENHACLIICLSRGLLQCSTRIESKPQTKYTSVAARMQWLVELMGHSHNVASGKTQLRVGRTVSQATRFLFQLFCCVVAVWCCPQSPILLGVAPFGHLLIPDDPRQWPEGDDEAAVSFCSYKDEDAIVRGCVDVVTDSVLSLLETTPWSQVTAKLFVVPCDIRRSLRSKSGPQCTVGIDVNECCTMERILKEELSCHDGCRKTRTCYHMAFRIVAVKRFVAE
ncbi:putative focadhesin isoform X2 [Apostichopus japonicus]|uniref:Putative focadhesin isoform X2 n=1 Tax=Stichopus japonicus TaxID=307972 RepID=A0A2G8KTI5_STIJA|nr:putative focadhesin isoform X2 [Apostichopus japonicus]